ncbi:MAG: MFS transporter [Jatrophihabitans sp.]
MLGWQPRRNVAVRGWLVAVLVYFAAVFNRASLGVAGLQAQHRFGISPGQLSTFVLLQLGVYAAMQVPTGVLVDRYGPRRLLLTSAALMGAAQLIFAAAPSYPMALTARALLGCGDAMAFISVLRYAAGQFAPRRYPVVVALTGMAGAAGNVLATVPLSAALAHLGWAPAFVGAGVVTLLTGALVFVELPRPARFETPELTVAQMRARVARVFGRMREAWQLPGTRVGFWLHFDCMGATTTFGVLWGVPYLIDGAGFSRASASAVLLLSVVVTVVASPLIGWATARWPLVRIPLAISVCVATTGGWIAMLALSRPPQGMLIVLVAVMVIGGPASAIGFALARDYNGASTLGTATGVVNVGGFVAAVLTSMAVGVLLDAVGTTVDGYRVAMAALPAVQLLGLIQLVRWWRRARHRVLEHLARGEHAPVRIVRRRWDLAERSGPTAGTGGH